MNLRAADLEMFEKLRISPGLLALAGVQRVSDQEAREDFGIVCAGDASGIVFPYQRNGHRVTCRLRRDFSEVDSKGKPKAKYISPKGDTRALYFLPGSDELLRDPSVPLLFVEAEKSVLAVTEWALRMNVRILPLGTGGCYGWRGKTGIKVNANGEREPEKGALAEVSFAKDGRIAGLLFDANATSNRKVRAARESFAALLRTQGAKVQVFTLPAGPWNGPDDYIASEGDSIFLDLLNRKPSDSKPTIICGAGDASTAADEAEK